MKRRCIILVIALVIVMLGAMLSVGIDTDFGRMHTQRLYLVNDNGYTVTANLFIPNAATAETPAPAGFVHEHEPDVGRVGHVGDAIRFRDGAITADAVILHSGKHPLPVHESAASHVPGQGFPRAPGAGFGVGCHALP